MKCQNCGAYVTKEFGQVFGGNDDLAYACFSCSTRVAIKRGAARSYDANPSRLTM